MGKAQYGIDTRLDGMLYGLVARPPVYGGKVMSFDDTEARKVPVWSRSSKSTRPRSRPSSSRSAASPWVAKNTWAAMKARDALKITWDDGPNGDLRFRRLPGRVGEGGPRARKGRARPGRCRRCHAKAKTKVEAEYFVPHLVQAPMEPPAATVRIKDGFCEAWANTQAPQATHDRLAKKLNLPADKVR